MPAIYTCRAVKSSTFGSFWLPTSADKRKVRLAHPMNNHRLNLMDLYSQSQQQTHRRWNCLQTPNTQGSCLIQTYTLLH